MSGPGAKAGQTALNAFSSAPGRRVTVRRAARRSRQVRAVPPVISEPTAIAIWITRRA